MIQDAGSSGIESGMPAEDIEGKKQLASQDHQHPPRIPSTWAERLVGPLSFAPMTARTERDSIENKFKKAGCVKPVESGNLSTYSARLHNGIMF